VTSSSPARTRSWGWIPVILLSLVIGAGLALGATTTNTFGLSNLLTFIYVALCAATALVVRRVTAQPGNWLGRRRVRRVVVLLVVLSCLLMVALPADGLGGTVLLLLLFLALCNVVLARATAQVAVSLPRPLDERQGSLRDRGYRLAYWLLAGIAGLLALVTYFAGSGARAWLGTALVSGPFIAFVVLAICLPTMIVAWIEPDQVMPAPPETRSHVWAVRVAAVMVATSLLVPLLAAIGVEVIPAQATQLKRYSSPAPKGSGCATVRRTTEIGFWFEARFVLDTEVCWNGHRARYLYGMNRSDCMASDWVLVSISTSQCVRRTKSNGTVEFNYTAWIHPDVLSFLARRLRVSVAVDRNGKVERTK